MTSEIAPRRLLMTIDAMGGVWRYAMDLAKALRLEGVDTVFAGFGPRPASQMLEEAKATGEIFWSDAPLDWTATDQSELARIPDWLVATARAASVDLLHLNLPSQAAGLVIDRPVIVVSHSCVTTWFAAVRGTALPPDWLWHEGLNRRGFAAADAIIAPSHSHADALSRSYGIGGIEVVHNSSRHVPTRLNKQNYCFAAGRWWDEGKNSSVLDGTAALTDYPIVAAGPIDGPSGQHVRFAFVDHRGALGHAEAMALMNEAAIFMSPSIYEPFGLAALEAARAGAALVLADIPTYRELWQDAALFAQPDDPAAFASAIDGLAGDRRLRQRLAHLAQDRSRLFSAAAQARAMLDVYRRTLTRRSHLTAAE
jgi:glycosyltransferase involved in cell wall biosynthesis